MIKHVILVFMAFFLPIFAIAGDRWSAWEQRRMEMAAFETANGVVPHTFQKVNSIPLYYRYTVQGKKPVRISCCLLLYRDNSRDSLCYEFFIRDGQMIYARESHFTCYEGKTQPVCERSKEYAFADGRLIDTSCFGYQLVEEHNQSEADKIQQDYRDALKDVNFHIITNTDDNPPDASVQTHVEYYADKKRKSVTHTGLFNGCYMPVGTDSLYAPTGEMTQIIRYENRRSKTEEGCHAGWTITTTIQYSADGNMKSRTWQRYAYQGTACNCGVWEYVDKNAPYGIREQYFGDCEDQTACE